MHEESFRLRNDPQKRRKQTIENEPAKQRVLFTGGDCLPGQSELFNPNGPKEHHSETQ